jgi:predicted RNase H-like HicB family nuclease
MHRISTEQEEDGRWIAEVADLPGVCAYGATRDEAILRAKVLALRVLADQLESDECNSPIDDLITAKIPTHLEMHEPWFFKFRYTSKRGVWARSLVVGVMALLFGLIGVFDPGPPFGYELQGVSKAAIFGGGFGIFIAFVLFDLGSLKRTIVITEDGLSCIPNLIGGGVDDACSGFGQWSRHEIRLLEVRSPRSRYNRGRLPIIVLHHTRGREAYLGVPRGTDLRFLSQTIADIPYPTTLDGNAVNSRAH